MGECRLNTVDDQIASLRGVESKVVDRCTRFNMLKLGCEGRDVGKAGQQESIIRIL